METRDIVDILSEVLNNEEFCTTNKTYVDVPVDNPMGESNRDFYRYRPGMDNIIQVEQWADGRMLRSVSKSLRNVIWNSCRLERVCAAYKRFYERWMKENNGIPYIETNVTDESDGRPRRSYEFMRDFWRKRESDGSSTKNLRLLLAEYGVGKSSFCQGIRNLVADEIRELFLTGEVSFPFVFDLNEFRSGDIDKFIESELHNKYRLSMSYRIFEMLCQKGIFMVVLDAWDQMRDARQIFPLNRSLGQMSPLWKKQGKVLITCRRSFYQQQLKGKYRSENKLSQDAELYKLAGFNRDSVIDYFRYDAEERKRRGVKALIPDEAVWVEHSWELNNELFSKPLNLRLLVRHFEAISKQINLFQDKADTYQFLRIVLEDWRQKSDVADEGFLKELVSQTLYSGLNRSIPLQQFEEVCDREKWKEILTSLQSFDFVSIDEGQERIEFRLAAFQEFLWAYFALEELKTRPEDLDNTSALIRHYLLIREVREWICKVLGGEEEDCLEKQLQYVKYKSRNDVGYRGSNALTLLCDLNSLRYYRERLEAMKSNLRRSPLMGTDFRGLDLSGADFFASDLEGADFSYTKLDKVNFKDADLAQTKWREHESMTKCAFLTQEEVLCVVTGTKSGGVLTYRIENGAAAGTKSGGVLTYRVESGALEVAHLNDVINDLAGDRGGIYTASSDGWVGYLDNNGNLRNAYIAQNGLQSITNTNNESCVYVGADNQGIFRYNWNTGSKQEIEVDRPLGDGMDRISDIHYYSNKKQEDYIAYTLSNRKLLVLLEVMGKNEGKVRAICRIHTEKYRFSDICFADDMLIYTVVGEGIFGMPVDELIGEIPEEELLIDFQKLLSLPEAESICLSWANESKTLMAVAKQREKPIEKVYTINMSLDSRKCDEIDLDWICDGHNFGHASGKMGGFCVSGDGKYVAFSGVFLAVLRKMGTFYALIGKPIEARISCKEADFKNCKGINKKLADFVIERGAIFKGGEETR